MASFISSLLSWRWSVCWSMARGSRGACPPAGGGRAACSSVGGTRAVFLSNSPTFVEQLQRELEFVFAFTLRERLEQKGAILCPPMCHTRAIEERREVPSIFARTLDGSHQALFMPQQSEVAVLRFSVLLRAVEPLALLLSLSRCLAKAGAVLKSIE